MKTLDSTQENYEVNLDDMNINERACVDLVVVVDHSGIFLDYFFYLKIILY